jgi:GNAT superfamily N-acetyltransferase
MVDGMLTFRTAYWQDGAAREAFKKFIFAIHGVDFGEWDRGYWDDDYRPYSYFEGDRVVASMCVYTMPAVVHGERCRVAQVSGVGTVPEYRRQGLNRRLHQAALAEQMPAHRFAFLFADDEAIPFYRACGFKPVAAHAALVALPAATSRPPEVARLDMGDAATRERLYRLAAEREPASNVFATHNPKLLMYHLLYRLREHVWEVPSLDAVVLMRREGERVTVYDVLAARMPTFERLLPLLAGGGAREAEFRFPVDRLEAPTVRLRELPGHNVHVMGDFNLGGQPIFPFTAQA